MSRWRMAKPCADCPFSDSVAGVRLRESLRPGRIAEIEGDLRAGQHFLCHKTTTDTGDGSNRVCAGALDYQGRLGVSSNYQRVCERLEKLGGKA